MLKMHLHYTGTFGVIAKAKKKDVIESVVPVIEKIKLTNFYISKRVIEETLKEAGEIMND